MYLNHPNGPYQGVQPENVFFVSNDQRVQMGCGYVVPFVQNELYPERPLHFYVYMDAQPTARSILYGALLARAVQIRQMQPEVPARLYTLIGEQDASYERFYASVGFKDDDGEELYRFLPVPGRTQPPMGMMYASIPLETPELQDMLLTSMNAFRIQPVNRDYLTLWRQQPHFMALAYFRDNIPVSELLVTGSGESATLVHIHTLPQYRRQGLAYMLLGAACVHLRDQGVQYLYTHVFRRNVPQMTLMKKLNGQYIRTVNKLPGINI